MPGHAVEGRVCQNGNSDSDILHWCVGEASTQTACEQFFPRLQVLQIPVVKWGDADYRWCPKCTKAAKDSIKIARVIKKMKEAKEPKITDPAFWM